MSVTVADILELPCLQGARVVAGKRGLDKILSSVSVLEFSDPGMLQQELFNNNEFYGSEIVITAFANIPNDVEQQCANIRRLAGAGEVGLILYYVGILMPRVDPKLIELADGLDFTLIVMPENRMDLRYSEVICEVMEAIFLDQSSGASLVSDVLAQMSHLPEHLRTVDAVLRMVRDRTRCSLILADQNRRTLGAAYWPTTLEFPLRDLPEPVPMTPVFLSNSRVLWRCPLEMKSSFSMVLYLVKEGTPIPRELVLQAVDVVRLAASLWSSSHAEVQISELVRAILRDEPMKMRRLGELFHIDVTSLHAMWLLRAKNSAARARYQNALQCAQDVLSPHCRTVVADFYEEYAVVFTDTPSQEGDPAQLPHLLTELLAEQGIEFSLTCCYHLQNTAEVHKAYLLHKDHLDDAVCIWPQAPYYTLQKLQFAAECRQIVDAGVNSLQEALWPLAALDSSKDARDLKKTLAAYFLDAGSSVALCGELLFLHKNTIKYRMGRICALLQHDVNEMPEKLSLYRAVSIWRLLEA